MELYPDNSVEHIEMQTRTNIHRKPVAKKIAFKKKSRNDKKAKVEKFVTSFYARYGEMMSRLSHE